MRSGLLRLTDGMVITIIPSTQQSEMFFHDDDFDGPSYRLREIIKRVKELRGQRWINLKESTELDSLQRELDEIRVKCSHRYQVILMFNRHCRFCKLCDQEDLAYRHD